MSEFYKFFLDFFSDKSKSIALKVSTGIFIVVFIFGIDLLFKISYNIETSNKLKNLQAINVLKKNYTNDSIHYRELLKLESNIFKRKHYLDFFESLVKKESNSFESKSLKKQKDNTWAKQNAKIDNKKSIRSIFWMAFSSNYLLFLLFPFIMILPILTDEKITGEFFIGWLSVIFMLLCIVVGSTWTSYFIPLIFNNAIWNYILNAIIHTAIILVISFAFAKKK